MRKSLVYCSFIFLLGSTACIKQVMLYFGQAKAGVQAPWFPAPKSEPGRHDVAVTATRQIIPGPGLPDIAKIQRSNNNLAVVRHDGRVWLAWRTAPDHFSSSKVVMQVMSSTDEKTWRLEHRFSVGADLREPEFLSLNGNLFLYFSELGDSGWTFDPKGIYATYRGRTGRWNGPYSLGLPKHVVWRVRMEGEKPYMIAYSNGNTIYSVFGGPPLQVKLLTTKDGLNWKPVDASRPSVHIGGGSETDFTFDAHGTLYGVIRNEGGERGHYGSLICKAVRRRMTEWSCRHDRKKYDSPYVFAHDGEVYLLARRNVTKDGYFDKNVLLEGVRNQLSYIIAGKRCSLWRFVGGGKRIAFVLDLPSRGDTCFPSVLHGSKSGEVIVYNYSSPINGPDLPWSVGQRKATRIYRHVLTFKRRP